MRTATSQYEPVHPRSLNWTSLPAEKMCLNVTDVSTSHKNREYPYEPAHPRSLIWTSLPAEKKCALTGEISPRHMRTANTHMSLRIPRSLIWTSLPAKKMRLNMRDVPTSHKLSEYPYNPAHLRSLIWTPLPAEKNAPQHERCPYVTRE